MTSLEKQLKKLSAPQTSILSHGRQRASILFDPGEAEKWDFDAILKLGCNGLAELIAIDENGFREFNDSLFSDTAIRGQRAVMTKEENEKLDTLIEKFCLRATPYFMLKATQKCLEWLVLRFNIHEYNVEILLRLILLYHDSNYFVRIVRIIQIPDNDARWNWLKPMQKNGIPLRRQLLINRCQTDMNFLTYVCETVPKAIEQFGAADVKSLEILFTFYVSVVIGTLESAGTIQESLIAAVMPFIAQGLRSSVRQYKLSSYMIVSQLAVSATLASTVVQTLIKLISMALLDEYMTEKSDETKDFLIQKLLNPSNWKLSNLCAVSALRILMAAFRKYKEDRSKFEGVFGACIQQMCRTYPEAYDTARAKCSNKKIKGCFEKLADLPLFDPKEGPSTAAQDLAQAASENANTEKNVESNDSDAEAGVTEPPPQKKAKKSKPKNTEEQWLKKRSQTLESNYTSINAEILPELLKDLNRLCNMSDKVTRRNYCLELVLGILYRILDGDEEWKANISKDTIRIDLFIRCLRESKKPTTVDLALQILAIIATLYQDSVLTQLMSVFTFWGIGLVKRDDPYSLRVLNKTLGTVIPAIMRQRGKGSKSNEKSVFEVFKSFAVALPDIPVHRRSILLKGLLKASWIADHEGSEYPAKSENVPSVNHGHFWSLLCVLIDYHVSGWDSAKEKAKRDEVHPDIELILDLLFEYSAVDNLSTALNIFWYLLQLDAEINSVKLTDIEADFRRMLSIIPVSDRSQKQLWHFNYVVIGLLQKLIGSKELVVKLAHLPELTNEIQSLCQQLINVGLRFRTFIVEKVAKSGPDNVLNSEITFWKVMQKKTDETLNLLCSLLPASVLLNVIVGLLESGTTYSIRKNALDLLNAKLTQQPTPFTVAHVPQLNDIAVKLGSYLSEKSLKAYSKEPEKRELVIQITCFSLKLLCRVTAKFDKAPFEEGLGHVVSLVHGWRNETSLITANVLLCLSELVVGLGSNTLGKIPMFIPDLVLILLSKKGKLNENGGLILASCLTAMQKIIENLADFLSPYLSSIIQCLAGIQFQLAAAGPSSLSGKQQQQQQQPNTNEMDPFKTHIPHRMLQIAKYISALPPRVLMPAARDAHSALLEKNPEHLRYVFDVFRDHLTDTLDAEDVANEAQILSRFFTEALDTRNAHKTRAVADLNALEDPIIACVSSYCLKLTEPVFRPFMFRLTGEWTLLHDDDRGKQERLITLFRLATRLGNDLRALFLLFAGGVIKQSATILPKCNLADDSSQNDESLPQKQVQIWPGSRKDDAAVEKTDALLRAICSTIEICCRFDSGKFFTNDRFNLLMQPLIDQIDNITLSGYTERMRDAVGPAVAGLAVAVNDDAALKQMNYQMLIKTRSKKHRIRQGALIVAGILYSRLAEDIAPLLPETVPFIAELLEDGNEKVEDETHKLVQVLEEITGESLQQFF